VIELALRNRHDGDSDHVDGLSDEDVRHREGPPEGHK
jgi:hypothetical protein